MSRKTVQFKAAVLCLIMMSVPLGAQIQQSLGSINGTVRDPSQALIANAQIDARSVETNFHAAAKTNSQGYFSIAGLPIGTYTVRIDVSGFKSENYPNIVVEANRTATITSTLEVGQTTETVEVTSTPLLNQVDTTNGYILNAQTIANTPLGTGSFTQLAVLSPGVSADLLNSSNSNGGLGNQNIWANGRRATDNSISINGIGVNNLFNGDTSSAVSEARYTSNTGQQTLAGGVLRTNTSVYDAVGQALPTPAPETLEEIRVNTSMYDASEGSKSGAQITVLTKSGTNQFHGQAYDYVQNTVFNAAPFFYNANPVINPKVPALHRNQFGGTIGGPIIKNKLFFFGSYQGVRESDALGGLTTFTVPSFLTNDRSATTLASEVTAASYRGAPAVTASNISPAALSILNYKVNGNYLIPNPNVPLANQGALGYNVVQQGPASTFTADQFNVNVDYLVNSKDRLAEKYFYQSDPTTNPFGASSLAGFTQNLKSGGQIASVENAVTLTPSTTWEQRIGFTRQSAFNKTNQPITPQAAGINLFGLSTFPGISVATVDPSLQRTLGIGSTSNLNNTGFFQNQYSASSNIGWVVGQHTLYFGFNFDYTQLNIINLNNELARLSFTSFPNFLLGNLQTGVGRSVFYNGSTNRYYNSKQLGSFAQDNWRVSSNFTVNLGIRYDWNGPLAEKYGRLTNFYGNNYQYNAGTDQIVNNGLVFAGNNSQFGTKGVSDSTLTGRQWGFAPRIGFAWSPQGVKNLTIRSGFGLYYDRGEYFSEFSPSAGGGFNGPFGVTLAPPFTVPVLSTSANSLSAPFGNSAPIAPPGPGVFSSLIPNASQITSGTFPAGNNFGTYLFGGYDPANTLPYSVNWSFDVQWQPINSTVFTLGYVGNHGVHQVLPIPFNQPGIATPQNPINGQIYSYGFKVPGVAAETTNTFDGGNTDLRTPYLGYNPNSVFYKAEGVSSYNALQIGVQRRLTKGLQFEASYTWSHTLDEQSGLGLFFNGNNPLNPKQSYATSSYDRPHVFTFAYLYQFPRLEKSSKLVSEIFGGWALSGILTAESGQPYDVIDYSGAIGSIYYSTNVEIVDPVEPLKPGYTGSSAQLQGQFGTNPAKPSLNAAAFTYASQITPGTGGVPPCTVTNGTSYCDTFETGFAAGNRNIFRAPFQTQLDFGVQKNFSLSERLKLQFRADAFNLFNHPNFDAPNTTLTQYNGNNPPSLQPPSSTFGLVTNTLNSPRYLQLSVHVTF